MERASTKSAPGPQLKVLIVEDDKFLQKILATKFAKEGFEVQTAATGDEAVQLLLSGLPSIVLLDLLLPQMSGFEVLSIMKTNEKTKNIPVIVLSNLGQEEDVQRAQDLGAEDFLVKGNTSINDVVEKVKENYAKVSLRK